MANKVSRRNALITLGATAAAAAGGIALGSRATTNEFARSSNQKSTAPKAPTSKASPTKRPEGRPNIILFVSDDQAYQTVGGRDPLYISPNINKLIDDGYLLDRSYVTTSICPVSRASIFTGQLTERHGTLTWSDPIRDESFSQLFPFMLAEAGYQTGFVGKWGIGNPVPEERFDFFEGFQDQGKFFDDPTDKTHLTKDLTDAALAAITQFEKSSDPYLLIVCYKAPHGQADLPYHESFDQTIEYPDFDTSKLEFPSSLADFENLPEFLRTSRARHFFESSLADVGSLRRYLSVYAKLLYGVDQSVGKVLAKASGTNGLDQTEILFLSDNGMMFGDHGFFGKWYMYEPSVKVPIIWKPSIFSEHSEAIQKSFCLNIDIAPTALRAAGVAIPETYQGLAFQDLANSVQRNDYYYSYYTTFSGDFPVSQGIQNKRYKYVDYSEHSFSQLFDTAKDPSEINNLVSDPSHQDTVEKMRTKLASYKKIAGPVAA